MNKISFKKSGKYHFYTSLARFYDNFYRGKNYRAEAEFFYKIFKKHKNVKAGNILDVGCGTGSHLLHFSRYFRNIFGLDPNKPMLDIARRKCGKKSHFFWRRIQDFRHEPIFNLVVSFNSALNYLKGYRELHLAFKRIFSVLSNNGVVVVQLHNVKDKDYLIGRVAYDGKDKLIVVGDWLKRNKYGPHSIDFFYNLYSNGKWSHYHDMHREYFFNRDEISRAMKSSGFSNICIRETTKSNPPFRSSEFICAGVKKL